MNDYPSTYTAFNDWWLLERYRNHQASPLYFWTAWMWRIHPTIYPQLRNWETAEINLEHIRNIAWSVVWYDRTDSILLARNTTEWLKMMYRLCGVQWWDIMISDQENWATKQICVYDWDYWNTKKLDIATMYPDDCIAEDFDWWDITFTKNIQHHTIVQIPFWVSSTTILDRITQDTKLIVISRVSRRTWQ